MDIGLFMKSNAFEISKLSILYFILIIYLFIYRKLPATQIVDFIPPNFLHCKIPLKKRTKC